MWTQPQQDAGIYELAHRLMGTAAQEEVDDRRYEFRSRYPGKVWIAEVSDDEFPSDREFTEVLCFDLSRNGLAFLIAEPPACSRLVLGLGAEKPQLFVAGEIAHTSLLPHPRQRMHLVGCRFLGRLSPPA